MNCLCRPARTVSVRIIFLDETDVMHEFKDDLMGQAILDVCFARLNLIETAYFGLRFLDEENQTHWLDHTTRISRQLKGSKDVYDLYFGVKFYAADPTKSLIEEITRYQLFLQVKQDVLQGRLPISFELAAELGAYIVQSEMGDYDSRRHSPGYVSEFRLVANQSKELENRVTELHQQLRGMSPAAAELNYLDKVKWNDMYGVDLHPVLGEDSVEYFLGLTPSGIVVLRDKITVAYYYWPRITKVHFKGRYFMLRVCDKNNEISTYGFETPRKSACRHLWRCCVEHHAFFRLVRVSPIQTHDGELFSLGSRFRYSGRTEKQAMRDAMVRGRPPPMFKRTPSRRQPRRCIDEILDNKNNTQKRTANKQEIKSISIPQPAQAFESPYRSTCNIPNSLSIRKYTIYGNGNAPDSPRSTRSAPWSRSQQKGLFGVNSSPRSVRSASSRKSSNVPTHRIRSSSVDSHSSNDSKACKRQRHRNRRTSDNESELSRGSARSHNSHRKRRHRSRHRRNESGSENEGSRRSFSGHRKSTGSIELLDANNQQWRDGQRRRNDGSGLNSSIKSENDYNGSGHKSRRHRKNRPSSRSPSEGRTRIWSSELAKHLQFDLVETAGMTEDQLREIPYTVVETQSAKQRNSNNSSVKVHKNHAKDRVDRIRGIYLPENNKMEQIVNGSIRSASTISSRDCDRNASLVRMMSSLSMGDFVSPSGSSLSPLEGSALRVSHEHTDSGLGADQDYAYSSERSSDSTKYGTNKSSGASVTSGKHLKNQSTYGAHDSVSSGKPPLHPNHHYNIHNHRTTTTTSIPVHSSNNRLSNNTIFHNNQYTFSLNRYDDSGYLESTGPLSSASLYGDGPRVSRGTKSDIGVPIRRPSKALLNSSSNIHYNRNKDKLTSVKSDFLLSYLNNNHNGSNTSASKNCAHNSSDRCSLNNNSDSNDCTNSSAYHISGVTTSDFSKTYKTGAKYFYSNVNTSTNSNLNSNSRRLETNDLTDRINTTNTITTTQSSHTINEQQRNRIINFLNRPHVTSNVDAKNFDPKSKSPSNSSNQIMTDTGIQNYSFKSNPSNIADMRDVSVAEKSHSNIRSSQRSNSLELILTPIIQSIRRIVNKNYCTSYKLLGHATVQLEQKTR
ncbi:band 4.1-like protein 4 isoform X2 [Contarinia nasturtii]|uniref:band 4.1-like protein 4 isoform X2 n=1 Tax=Contarinia nasturtii TaxID=265458 RepID=UPI0012D44CFC|nr:band 4.1-like protein 4 isoform X2 [Contarinia nasturtii]